MAEYVTGLIHSSLRQVGTEHFLADNSIAEYDVFKKDGYIMFRVDEKSMAVLRLKYYDLDEALLEHIYEHMEFLYRTVLDQKYPDLHKYVDPQSIFRTN